MSAASIIPAANVDQASGSSTTNAYANLSSDEFIKIMLSELTNQDPFEPTDSSAILEQLSSLRNIEGQLQLQTSMESLVSQNAVSSAASLIGQFVSGIDRNGNNQSGIVESVRVENDKAIFQLEGGGSLPAENTTDLQRVDQLDNAAMQSLLRSLLLSDSAAMIGKTVSGTTNTNVVFEGKVEEVKVTNDSVELELDTGQRVQADWVTSMR